jgi:hypothetical protein
MQFYCGMDLSARECQVCVLDEELSLLVQQKVRHELPGILRLIEPFNSMGRTNWRASSCSVSRSPPLRPSCWPPYRIAPRATAGSRAQAWGRSWR